jgi:hypothetical protein
MLCQGGRQGYGIRLEGPGGIVYGPVFGVSGIDACCYKWLLSMPAHMAILAKDALFLWIMFVRRSWLTKLTEVREQQPG